MSAADGPRRAAAPCGALACDLDGTLLSPDGAMAPEVARLLAEAAKRFPVCILTGRMEPSAEPFWRRAGLATPLGSYNGAKLGIPGQAPIYEAHVDPAVARRLDVLALSRGWHINYYVRDRVLVRGDDARVRRYAERFGVGYTVADEQTIYTRPAFTKILYIVEASELSAALAEAKAACPPGGAHLTTSSDIFVEALPMGCDKGGALRHLARWSGVPPERWVAVGDQVNDAEMLQAAGMGVAVEDGHPDLKAAADWVCPPLWRGGLRTLLDRFFA